MLVLVLVTFSVGICAVAYVLGQINAVFKSISLSSLALKDDAEELESLGNSLASGDLEQTTKRDGGNQSSSMPKIDLIEYGQFSCTVEAIYRSAFTNRRTVARLEKYVRCRLGGGEACVTEISLRRLCHSKCAMGTFGYSGKAWLFVSLESVGHTGYRYLLAAEPWFALFWRILQVDSPLTIPFRPIAKFIAREALAHEFIHLLQDTLVPVMYWETRYHRIAAWKRWVGWFVVESEAVLFGSPRLFVYFFAVLFGLIVASC